MKKLGEIIRTARLENNMTQLDLAYRLGYDSMQFVSLFERGLSKVPMKVLGKLFVILKFPEKQQKQILKMIMDEYTTKVVSEIADGKKVAL